MPRKAAPKKSTPRKTKPTVKKSAKKTTAEAPAPLPSVAAPLPGASRYDEQGRRIW